MGILSVVSDADTKLVIFDKRLTEVRKDKKLFQDELAKKLDAHGAVIGRYERDEVKPSMEVAAKIAHILYALDAMIKNAKLKSISE